MKENLATSLPLYNFKPGTGFWNDVAHKIISQMIPYQWHALNDDIPGVAPSHCISNFKIAIGKAKGEYGGFVFQDSDLAKWIEAASYSLSIEPNPEIEKWIDEAVGYIEAAQGSDGYLNTYFTIKEPEKRWTNLRDCHELYCAGHMMEAAVAYYEATGKRKLLDIMLRMADHIESIFGPEEEKLKGYPGHPEIELALMRMYQVTQEPKLLKLATYFINERGQEPKYFIVEARKREASNIENACNYEDYPKEKLAYFQSHLPVREQMTVDGHSVRALYLLSGMIDVAVQNQDEALLQHCYHLFNNVSRKRMYVTGGVGSTHIGEAFTVDYDLPNDTVYAETCASIALIFAASRLLKMKADGNIADVMERALYNTCLAGMAMDARHFFYVNPLEVNPAFCNGNPDRKHVLPVRPGWYGCACCPPNLARLICSLSSYAYCYDEHTLQINTFLSGTASFELNGQKHQMTVDTNYPFGGTVNIRLDAGSYGLRIHLPAWAHQYTVKLNHQTISPAVENGYLVLDQQWSDGDTLELAMEMLPRRTYANPLVSADIGCTAIALGPVIYCMEEADNGKHLHLIRLPQDSKLETAAVNDPNLGAFTMIIADGLRQQIAEEETSLYSETPNISLLPCKIRLIPYYAWANRGENEMRVWVRE